MAIGTAATVGCMQEINPDNESIASYLERFKLFVQVNGIDTRKQAPTLLLVLGMKHYSLIRDLFSPGKPEDKAWDISHPCADQSQAKVALNMLSG